MLLRKSMLFYEEEESQTAACSAPTEGQIIETWCKASKIWIK